MAERMTQEEYIDGFPAALERGDILPYFQPQYNHATGRITGAEALMRCEDPDKGMQMPLDFIPALEEAGLIVEADLFLFERICLFQRSRLDRGASTVPISFNISRIDIADSGFIDRLEEIRINHDVPVKLLKAEITEMAAMGGQELVADAIDRLHGLGFSVEMDDFGAGYSSLNILKDLEFDVIKLDMEFLKGDLNGRGGTILQALVQMAKWLGTPTIAEGVETVEQADYMKSIGCTHIQGYLYSKPVPEDVFDGMLARDGLEPTLPAMTLIESMHAKRFWDPDSLETLIFSSYVGAAAIFAYEHGIADILRVNSKYIQELGMNLSEQEVVHADPWEMFDEENKAKYIRTVEKAISSGEEQICETWRKVSSNCCGDDEICIRSTLRAIGRANDQAIIYVMIQNITAEKRRFADLDASERKFRNAAEHANVYAWEYTIGTREMRPCFRCMRDLGLPPLVRNYPEPVIKSGIFPEDYADMYRDWHRQLAEGVEHLEAIIPLTVGRVPFHVRYTLERDELGRPLKAYGSATLVVDDGNGEELSDSSQE